jgi:3D (Asp-Asp-Asp) domain-containing protein
MRLEKIFGLGAVCAALLVGCSSEATGEATDATGDELAVGASFRARGTGYYPDSSALEGGFVDRIGKPLRTLQDYLAGRAEYVSVAMDTRAFKYGTHLRIAQLEAKYGRAIDFRVVDTGGAFRGKGTSRIDVCVKTYRDTLDATINGMLDIRVASGAPTGGGTGGGADPTPPSDPSGGASGGTGGGGGGGGQACSNDGACNPGNDGAGLICEAGQCVPGCRRDYHCPGSKVCRQGTCQ